MKSALALDSAQGHIEEGSYSLPSFYMHFSPLTHPDQAFYSTLSPGRGAATAMPLPSRCVFSSAGVPVSAGNVP